MIGRIICAIFGHGKCIHGWGYEMHSLTCTRCWADMVCNRCYNPDDNKPWPTYPVPGRKPSA